MKIIYLFLGIMLLSLTPSHGQITGNKLKIPADGTLDPSKFTAELDLEKIKKHIASGKLCYTINLVSTAIMPPKHPKPVDGVDGYFSSSRYVRVEGRYLRSNGLLLRSDKSFNRNFGNNYEVLIYPDSRDPRKVAKNNVKITWRIPESQLRSFTLENVSVRYEPHGILITGDYKVDGIVFGVSLSLIPESCLI